MRQVRLQSELIKQGKKNTDKVSVKVPAILFDQPIEIADVRSINKSFGPEIDFLAAYFKANIEGSKDEILSFWHAGEKERIQEMLRNDDLFKRNQTYMARNPGLVVHGLVKQVDSISVLQGKTAVIGIPMRKEDGRFYIIRKPSNDLELAIIEASFIR